MDYRNRLAATVRAFWDGNGRSIDDQDGRRMAIARATRDLMARTLRRTAPGTEDFTKGVTDALLPRIDEWFLRPQESVSEDAFDDWHRKACEEMLTVLRTFYTNQDGTAVAYGKAQKIVNMTMKGLYCLEGAWEMEGHFQYCHMALDSFILEWFCRQVMPWYNRNEKNKVKLKKTAMVSWSMIPEGSQTVPYGYDTYVRHIRDYFKSEHPYDGLTPLQAEFFIWSEIQLAIAAESLYGQDIGKEEAIAKAREQWDIQWTDVQRGDINKQFDRCKKEFKLRPLEEKVEFLRTRVDQLCRCLNVSEHVNA